MVDLQKESKLFLKPTRMTLSQLIALTSGSCYIHQSIRCELPFYQGVFVLPMGRINSIRIVGDNPIISKSLVIACALKHYTNRPASTSSVSLPYRSARIASSKEFISLLQPQNCGLLFVLSLSEIEIQS